MRKIFLTTIFLGLSMFFLYSEPLNEEEDPDDNWVTISERHGVAGQTHVVKSMQQYKDSIYVAGKFMAIKDTLANSVARLDLSTGVWLALGSGLSGTVVSLSVVNNEKIYAAGRFTVEEDDHIHDGVYVWNGESWEEITLEFDGEIFTTAVDNSGNLYVAGEFRNVGSVQADNIVKWDGEKWSPLGAGLNHEVKKILIDNDGNLLARGGFYKSGEDESIDSFAKWDGEKWISQSKGGLESLLEFTIGEDGYLYLFGYFEESDEEKIVKWDGNEWIVLNKNSSDKFSGNINILEVDKDGVVYVGGYFYSIEGLEVGGITKWDGEKWHSLNGGVDYTPIVVILPIENDVYIGGHFRSAGETVADNIARWDGKKWNSIGDGIGDGYYADQVNAVKVDSNGNLLVGGSFNIGGSPYVDDIYFAVYDGEKWIYPDSGLDGSVNAILSDNNGNYYFGGNFITAGGLNVNHIAKWDGENWSSLGSGIDQSVKTLALDKSGNLYAGGLLHSAGNVKVSGVAKWDGEKWSALDSSFSGSVSSLYSDKNGNVYAGGCLKEEGSESGYYVLKWNGSKWSKVGPQLPKCVDSVAVDKDGVVYVSGEYFSINDVNLGSIIKLSGNKWESLGSGLNGAQVKEIKPDSSGNVYFCGSIHKKENEIYLRNIARWNGESWNALGSGVQGGWDSAYCIDIDAEGNLYVGGDFIQAGNKYSNLVAKYIVPDEDKAQNGDDSSVGCSVLFF